jgi:hypothetical protein
VYYTYLHQSIQIHTPAALQIHESLDSPKNPALRWVFVWYLFTERICSLDAKVDKIVLGYRSGATQFALRTRQPYCDIVQATKMAAKPGMRT